MKLESTTKRKLKDEKPCQYMGLMHLEKTKDGPKAPTWDKDEPKAQDTMKDGPKAPRQNKEEPKVLDTTKMGLMPQDKTKNDRSPRQHKDGLNAPRQDKTKGATRIGQPLKKKIITKKLSIYKPH